MENNQKIIQNCKLLLEAYKSGKLGQIIMPEDSNPLFKGNEMESRLAYFTLPMALNYQRNSYALWESALKTYQDEETRVIFDISKLSGLDQNKIREYLTKYKLALQPNKQVKTWVTIAKTIRDNFGSFEELMRKCDNDYLKLKQIIQIDFKKGFPYLSGPKIFNYWSFIIKKYGKIPLKNAEYIEIAPDTHITQCSVLLGLITKEESEKLSKDKISEIWRKTLSGSGINPIDMHPPLWFWSRNGFLFKID
jgi:hypothetical protein